MPPGAGAGAPGPALSGPIRPGGSRRRAGLRIVAGPSTDPGRTVTVPTTAATVPRRAGAAGVLLAAAALCAAAGAAPPSPAAAATFPEGFQLTQLTPSRIWAQTSWIPFALPQPPDRVYRYRLGRFTFVGPWIPASASTLSTSEALARMARDPLGAGGLGLMGDRALTRREARRMIRLAELYRDADVLVVTAGHPVCAGIRRAEARAIATGRVTRWSQVVAGAPVDAIRVHHLVDSGGVAVPHLGTRWVGRLNRFRVNYPPTAVGSPDGGVSRAAAGDGSVAAVTTWSRLRGVPPGVCVVPLNGVAPSDQSVRSLSYPEAFPVSYYVTRRTRERSAAGRASTAVKRRAMRAFLRSPRLTRRLAAQGLLVR